MVNTGRLSVLKDYGDVNYDCLLLIITCITLLSRLHLHSAAAARKDCAAMAAAPAASETEVA